MKESVCPNYLREPFTQAPNMPTHRPKPTGPCAMHASSPLTPLAFVYCERNFVAVSSRRARKGYRARCWCREDRLA